MKLSITQDDWVQVPVPGDKQITNQGSVSVRIEQSATKPADLDDGEILSTYSYPYATAFVGGMVPCWVRSIDGNSVIKIQSV